MSDLAAESQRAFAVEVLSRLRQAGYEAYWAGGCVRDQLLGKTPKDYDVATSATPDEIQRLFGKRTLAIGAAFGVMMVLGPRGAGQIEVATFRSDGQYVDGRHPESITFAGAREDAQRRDFTINGLFYDPLTKQVIDFVGGEHDLAERVIRAIGDPRARFTEDKLRLLRAVRFAARLGFVLDGPTFGAVHEMAEQIVMVSAERIAQEMHRILVHASRAAGVELLRQTGLLSVLLPELDRRLSMPGEIQPAQVAETWRRMLGLLSRLEAPEFPLALAGLLDTLQLEAVEHDAEDVVAADRVRAQATLASGICRRWRLSNHETDRAVWLVGHRGQLGVARSRPWSQIQPLLVHAWTADLLALEEARALELGQPTQDLQFCRERLSLPRELLDPRPILTGDHLLRHGIPAGKIYKRLLDRARAAQLDGEIRTLSEALALVDRLRHEGAAAEPGESHNNTVLPASLNPHDLLDKPDREP